MESKGDHTGIGSCIALALSDQRNLKISSGGKFLELHGKSLLTIGAGKAQFDLTNS